MARAPSGEGFRVGVVEGDTHVPRLKVEHAPRKI